MVDDYKGRFDEAIEACWQAGGKVYNYGYYPKAKEFFRRNLGDDTFTKWVAVKEQYDPGRILGAELF